MDRTRLRKLLLVALGSTHPGESYAAIEKVRKLLKDGKVDIHWLVDSLDGKPPKMPMPSWDPTPYAPPRTQYDWEYMLIFAADHRYRLRPREDEFIGSLLNQSLKYGWRPSMKQHEWLSSIYQRLRKFEQ